MKIKFEREVRLSVEQLTELASLFEREIPLIPKIKLRKKRHVFEWKGKHGIYKYSINPTRWKLITVLEVNDLLK